MLTSRFRHLHCCLAATNLALLCGAAVVPDPSECSFAVYPPKAFNNGPASQTANLVALSGDGRTAIQQTRYQSDFFNSISINQDEYLIRDGVRTELTHYTANYGPGQPAWTTSGPDWYSVSLPFDGSFVLTTKDSINGSAVLLSLPGKAETPLPVKLGLLVSGNGGWVIGQDADFNIIRLRVLDRQSTVVIARTQVQSAKIASVSQDGGVIFGRGYDPANEALPERHFTWSTAAGFHWLTSPEGFYPYRMASSGGLFIGDYWLSSQPLIPTVPAYWSPEAGLVRLPVTLPDFAAEHGRAWLVSGDGQFIFGTIWKSFEPRNVVWTRDGKHHRLEDLIRGVDLGDWRLTALTAVSHDGRTIAGTAYRPTAGEQNFIARIALPGEGPKAQFKQGAGGQPAMEFRAKKGFRYQPQQAAVLGQWQSFGIEIAGDDAQHSIEIPAITESAGFVRVLVEAQ